MSLSCNQNSQVSKSNTKFNQPAFTAAQIRQLTVTVGKGNATAEDSANKFFENVFKNVKLKEALQKASEWISLQKTIGFNKDGDFVSVNVDAVNRSNTVRVRGDLTKLDEKMATKFANQLCMEISYLDGNYLPKQNWNMSEFDNHII